MCMQNQGQSHKKGDDMKIKSLGKNQTEVELSPSVTVLVSYETPVAACVNGLYYRTMKKWSATTTRHINSWLEGINAQPVEQDFFSQLGVQ